MKLLEQSGESPLVGGTGTCWMSGYIFHSERTVIIRRIGRFFFSFFRRGTEYRHFCQLSFYSLLFGNSMLCHGLLNACQEIELNQKARDKYM